jgi:DNA-binding CsgD family transcriptional regulator/tetratricopeptide (TPR) repeat protein
MRQVPDVAAYLRAALWRHELIFLVHPSPHRHQVPNAALRSTAHGTGFLAGDVAERPHQASQVRSRPPANAAAAVGKIGLVAGRPAGVAGPLVGRARELAAVASLIAETDRTGVVLIGGEAGLGKTRLVDEIVAAHQDTTVVRGGAVPRTTPLPFELIRTAIEPHARAWSEIPDRLQPLLPAAHAVVGGHPTPEIPATPVVEQVQAAAEILRLLQSGQTIFVFEDIHWADPESLEVIDRLMVAGPLQASVLVTYRPEALRPGHPVNTFLQRAERRAHAVQLRLEPLRREEVGQYLTASEQHVDQRTVENVHLRTGGNPLFLSELVSASDDDRDLTEGLPWTLAEILRPEIDRLPVDARAVAEAVAVLGADAEFDLVAAAIAVDETELVARLRHLVNAGILVESGPDRFDFRHELVREAVADGLFTRERRRIHAAAHDALLVAGSDDEAALITHATEAGRIKEAADVARGAALRALKRGSSHQALAFAEQALLLHTDDLTLIRTAVFASWTTEQHRVALDHLARWDELVGRSPEPQAEVLHWRVRLQWELGDGMAADSAAEELRLVIDHLEPGPAQAQALADLAQHQMLSGQFEEAVATADKAIDLASRIDAPVAALQARAERASALLQTPGKRQLGIAELTSVASDAESAGEFVVASRALNNLPVMAAGTDPRRHLERMRSASRRAGMAGIASDWYRINLLELAEVDGDRDEYQAILDSALADMGAHPLALFCAAFLAMSDGRLEDARRIADRLDAGRRSAHVPPTVRAGLKAVIELQATGNVDEVRAWLVESPLTFANRQLLLTTLSDVLHAGLGPEVLKGLEADAGSCCDGPVWDGLAAELRGDLEVAEGIYADIAASTEGRSVITLAEVDLGRARIAQAQAKDDRVHVQSAARRLARWPGRLRDRVEDLLDEPCRDPIEPGILTPREQQVAKLVVRGLTNGGIAEELFISTKTASVHVSNILSKLAMSSRTEIAAWVAAGGLETRV